MFELDFPGQIVNHEDDIISNGYGPCIGVAVIWNKQGSLIHSNDPRMLCGDDFFEDLKAEIPEADRSGISPIIFGGQVDKKDRITSKETNAAKQWVRDQLADLGFKQPREAWCPEGTNQSQNVHVQSEYNVVTIITLDPHSSATHSTVDFLF